MSQKKSNQLLKESYVELLGSKSLTSLNNRIKLVESYRNKLSAKDQKSMTLCLKSIKENASKDYSKATNQLYKLNILVESLVYSNSKLLKEAPGDKGNAGAFKVGIENVGIFTNIVASTTNDVEDGTFEIVFKFPVYPTEAFYRDRFYEVIDFKEKLVKEKRKIGLLLNKFFPNKFGIVDSTLEVASREQLEDKIFFEKMNGQSSAKVSYLVDLHETVTKQEVEHDLPLFFQELAKLLMEKFEYILTPELGLHNRAEREMSGAKRGKSVGLENRPYVAKTEDRKRAKRSEGDYNDDWIKNMFMSGTIEDDGDDDDYSDATPVRRK